MLMLELCGVHAINSRQIKHVQTKIYLRFEGFICEKNLNRLKTLAEKVKFEY